MMDTGASTEKFIETDAEITEDLLKAKWPELAKDYVEKQRLFSMLTTTTLIVTEDGGDKIVTFRVVNESQKVWVESKLLHELEGKFRKIVGSSKIYLRVEVLPDDSTGPKIYLPGDKAKELMTNNDEVKNLVKDLGLDIK
jgi:hypothetical protein